jgi:hypothetical protein
VVALAGGLVLGMVTGAPARVLRMGAALVSTASRNH